MAFGEGKTVLPPLRGYSEPGAGPAEAPEIAGPGKRPDPVGAPPVDAFAGLDDLALATTGAPARAPSARKPKRRGPGHPRLDEEEAGCKLPLYVRRHTRRWLRNLEGDIEDNTGRIINRSQISRAILTGTERSEVTLDRCADEPAIAATVEAHLKAGRILLTALRAAGLDLDQLSPGAAARHFASAASEGRDKLVAGDS
jgi:hypothetical protein